MSVHPANRYWFAKNNIQVKLYDRTGVLTAVVTDSRHYATFHTAKAVLISNILPKENCVILTMNSTINHTTPDTGIPEEITQLAMSSELLSTATLQTATIKDSPVKIRSFDQEQSNKGKRFFMLNRSIISFTKYHKTNVFMSLNMLKRPNFHVIITKNICMYMLQLSPKEKRKTHISSEDI